MESKIQIILFIFGFFAIVFSVLIYIVGNPIYSIISLIFVFVCIGGILFTIGCEFIAVTFLIVYVGAIGVLFLFVVMMLNIKITELNTTVWRAISTGLLFFALFLFVVLWIAFSSTSFKGLKEYTPYDVFSWLELGALFPYIPIEDEPIWKFSVIKLIELAGGIDPDFFFSHSLFPREYFNNGNFEFERFFEDWSKEVRGLPDLNESLFFTVPADLPFEYIKIDYNPDDYEEFIFSIKNVKFFTFFRKDEEKPSNPFLKYFKPISSPRKHGDYIDLTIPTRNLTQLQELFFNGWGITTPYDKEGNWTGVYLGVNWQKLYPGSVLLMAARLRLPPESFWQMFIIYDTGIGRPPLWWQTTYKFWWNKIQNMSSGFNFLEMIERHFEKRTSFYWGVVDLDTWDEFFIGDDWQQHCRYMVKETVVEEIIDESGDYPKFMDPNFQLTRYNIEYGKFKNFGKDYLEETQKNWVNIYTYLSQFKQWELEEAIRVSDSLKRRHLPYSPSWVFSVYSGRDNLDTTKSLRIPFLDGETLAEMGYVWWFTGGISKVSESSEILSWWMNETNWKTTRTVLLNLLKRDSFSFFNAVKEEVSTNDENFMSIQSFLLNVGFLLKLNNSPWFTEGVLVNLFPKIGCDILVGQMDKETLESYRLFLKNMRSHDILLIESPIVNSNDWFFPIYNNTELLGWILYTYNFEIFLIISLILLVSMIGSIVLVLNQNINIRRQIIFNQVIRNLSDSIILKTKK